MPQMGPISWISLFIMIFLFDYLFWCSISSEPADLPLGSCDAFFNFIFYQW